MTRFGLLLLVPLAALPVLGCESATEGRDERRSEIRLDLGEILRPSTSAQQGIAISVIDSVRLTVEEEDGSSEVMSAALTPGEEEVVFAIAVDPGLIGFSADVLSNNGTVLYSGSTEEQITEDGFQVVIPMDTAAPVMVVFPDSIEVNPFAGATADIMNRGIGTLAWQVGDISPANSCRVIGTIDVFGPCLDFEIESGTVESGAADVFFMFTPADTTETFNLELTSEQGSVTILVSVVQLSDLVPEPDPDEGLGFCRIVGSDLLVTIRNQGSRTAGPSTTRVAYPGGDTIDMPTPSLDPGASADLLFDIESCSFNPDCNFTIMADALDEVSETVEANNSAAGVCIG